jgi:hypothetical protein
MGGIGEARGSSSEESSLIHSSLPCVWCWKQFSSTCRHASQLSRHVVHCTSRICQWNWKHYILHAFVHSVFSARIITIHITLWHAPHVRMHRFRPGKERGSILYLLRCHQKHCLNNAYNCLQCSKNGVRMYDTDWCEFKVSKKKGGPTIQSTFITSHTLTLCHSQIKTGFSVDQHLLLWQFTYPLR